MRKHQSFVFLDRDGVINEELGERKYISRWDQVKFIAGTLSAIRQLTLAEKEVVIVSNQAGVSKGFVTEKQLAQVTTRMLKEVEKHGGKISGVYYCTHHPDANCSCRKPQLGLFQKAIHKKRVNWAQSIMVGDTLRDIQAGKQLGCYTILVLSGKTQKNHLGQWPLQPDQICENLLSAVPWILRA